MKTMNDPRIGTGSAANAADAAGAPGMTSGVASGGTSRRATRPRAPYAPPRLEPLGAWRSLTLQQSIPVGPGSFLFDPSRVERLG